MWGRKSLGLGTVGQFMIYELKGVDRGYNLIHLYDMWYFQSHLTVWIEASDV